MLFIFFNISSEEFAKINDCVSKYALHNYHVAFYLKRRYC